MTILIKDNTPVVTIDSILAIPKPTFEETCLISWAPTQDEQDDCELDNKLYCVLLRNQMTPDQFCQTFNMKPSTHCLLFFVQPGATKEQAEQGIRELMERADEVVEYVAPAGTDRGFLDIPSGDEQ